MTFLDIKSMNALMEIQALQTMSSNGSSTAVHNDSSVFSTMMNELLTTANRDVAQLGSVQQIVEQGDATITSGSTSSYVASFLLNGDGATASSTPSIAQYTNRDFTGTTAFENVLAGANHYADTIAQAAATYNVPEKLIAAVMKQESNFNPTAVSNAGATGLMQLMPSTAKYLGVHDATNPEQNIMGGAKYLRKMLDQFDGDIATALAAYNAGPGNVQKYNGIPPFKETQNYVNKVMNYYNA